MATRHPDLLRRDGSAVFVVDVQEGFRSHIHGFDDLVGCLRLLLRGTRHLGLPAALSEQYPKGLGSTVHELEEVLPADTARFEKLEISSRAAPGWGELPAAVREAGAIVVAGIETHVCVQQTVLDLLASGQRVHVPADAVGSRDPWQREMALERMARAGATITTVEAALFELLSVAGTDDFRQVQRFIKEHDAARSAAMGVA